MNVVDIASDQNKSKIPDLDKVIPSHQTALGSHYIESWPQY